MAYQPRRIDLLGERRILPSDLPPSEIGRYLFSSTGTVITPVPEQIPEALKSTERKHKPREVHPVLVLMPDGKEVEGTIRGSTLNAAEAAAMTGDLLDKAGNLHTMPSIELEIDGLEQPEERIAVQLRGIVDGEALPIDVKTPGIPASLVPYRLLDRYTRTPISASTGAPGHIGSLTIH